MEPKVRKTLKRVLIIGVGIYAFWVNLLIHAKIVGIENPRYSLWQSFEAGFVDIFKNPFRIFPLPPGTRTSILASTIIWAAFISLALLVDRARKHDNPDTVQGDAQWLKDLKSYNRRFTEPFGTVTPDGKNNIIFSEEMYMSMDNQKTRRNINVCVIGGSGSGKSYNFVGPNIMQINCSYAVTDPSGGMFKDYGSFLEYHGYRVKCFNLTHMERGNRYNPFNYIHSDKDVGILVNTLIKNTTPPEANKGDPFWEKSETALLVALIAYLHHYTSPECQNFSNVMRLMRAANIDENDSSTKSPLDYVFDEVANYDPESFALKQYQTFKMGAGKTLKSILISCAVRLQAFDLSDVANLTDTDDIDLTSLGDEKSALFIIMPTGGSEAFGFLAAMMYSQMFQMLYEYAENTAEYSQLIIDGERQVIKTYRASGPKDSKQKAVEAKEFLARAKEGYIVQNEEFGWWELRTQADELVLYRGARELVEAAYEDICANATVICNSQQSNSGQRLPIHLRMLLDEFANIGQIPEFEAKVATMRKYEISVAIILQSLTQLQKMYKDNWSEIVGNCDTTIYLGGGADTVTTKWVSELFGKETRIVMNHTFGRTASTSMNRQGVELMAAAQIRVMPEDVCLVIPKSLFAYRGKKYMTHNHPQRELVESLDTYYFDREKTIYLDQRMPETDTQEETPEEVHGQVEEPTQEEELEKHEEETQKKQIAQEAAMNRDAEGEEIIEEPKDVQAEEAKFEEKVATKGQQERGLNYKEAASKLVVGNEEAWGVEELVFGESLAGDQAESSKQ